MQTKELVFRNHLCIKVVDEDELGGLLDMLIKRVRSVPARFSALAFPAYVYVSSDRQVMPTHADAAFLRSAGYDVLSFEAFRAWNGSDTSDEAMYL